MVELAVEGGTAERRENISFRNRRERMGEVVGGAFSCKAELRGYQIRRKSRPPRSLH